MSKVARVDVVHLATGSPSTSVVDPFSTPEYRIELEVYAFNPSRAARLIRAGFVEECRWREGSRSMAHAST